MHRALVRHAQNELGKNVGVPNHVGFENNDWPSIAKVREEFEALASATESRPTAPAASTSTRRSDRLRRRDANEPPRSRLIADAAP